MIASITARLALLFGAAASAVLVGLGVYVGIAVERHFVEGDRDLLLGKLQLVREMLARVRAPADLDALPQQLDAALVGHHDLSVMIVGTAGERLFASSGTNYPGPALAQLPTDDSPQALQAWRHEGLRFRGLAASADTGLAGTAPVRVVLALEISHHDTFMADFRRVQWAAVAIGIVVIGALGVAVARRGLRPVRQLAQLARGISAERLSERLDPERLPVELHELAHAFNRMLARLEDAFRRLNEFSSDLAHEIRTPLSNLMTQTEVALSRARGAEEYREALASNAEEFNRLARITSDMLFLAKSDNGLVVPSREAVDLAAEMDSLFEYYEALAEERGIALRREGGATVSGDRLMLRRAAGNLLSNAIAHTPAGGQVTVRIATEDGIVRLGVHNPGTPIPAEHLPRLFDRFYRADPSRREGGEGAGLGLAITRAIARAHGGDVAARSDADGTQMTMEVAA